MKKTKLISIALAALMIVGIIPMGIFSASAAETPAMPTTYPDGNVGKTEYFANFGEKITTTKKTSPSTNSNGTTQGYAKIENGKWVSYDGTGSDNYIWADDSSGSPIDVRNTDGASGIMFYLESSDDSKNSQFNISFNASGIKRTGTVDENTSTSGTQDYNGLRFVSGVSSYCGAPTTCTSCDGVTNAKEEFTSVINHTGNYAYREGTACTYYTYSEDGGWVKHSLGGGQGWYIGTKGDAWYYIPFSSFFYLEDDNSDVHKEDTAYGMSYTDIKERYNAAWNIWNFRIRQNKNTGMTLSFNDIYMIYPELAVASENASTKDLLPDLKITNMEPKTDNVYSGTYTAKANGDSVTISGTTGNDTSSKSDGRVWLGSKTVSTRDMTNAEGIRFHVDSSSLKADGAQLLLRLRLKDTKNSKDITSHVMLNDKNSGTYALTGGNIQYLLRTAGSLIYLKDEAGEWQPYYANDSLKTNQNLHADTFAIPSGYTGEVYIPMDSFYACVTGSWSGYALISYDKAIEYGFATAIDQIAIVQGYSETDTAKTANYSVTYSDFEIVYDEVEVTKTGVSVGDDLAMRVFAATADGATVESATYVMDGKTNTATVTEADGGYVVKCDGILPQDAGKELTITLNGKVGNVAVTNTVKTSVKEYCLDLIADDAQTDAAKDVAADLLRYAYEAQIFAAGDILNVTDPIVDNTTTSKIAAYGNAYTVAPEANVTKGESSAEGYSIDSAALRLENSLALKLDVTAADEAYVGLTVDGNENKVKVTDGEVKFAIGAADLNDELTIKLYVGENAVQTITYHMSDYFASALNDAELEQKDLVKALYCYCVSAVAYAAQ